MKPVTYDSTTKSTIVTEVEAARNSGHTWAHALRVAREHGYRGTNATSLMQFVGGTKKTKHRRRATTTTKITAKTTFGSNADPLRSELEKTARGIERQVLRLALDGAIARLTKLRDAR